MLFAIFIYLQIAILTFMAIVALVVVTQLLFNTLVKNEEKINTKKLSIFGVIVVVIMVIIMIFIGI